MLWCWHDRAVRLLSCSRSCFQSSVSQSCGALYVINQVKQELNATSKNVQDWLHTMGKNPQKKIVTHRFEPTSKNVLLFIGGLALSLVISIWGNLTQWREHQAWEVADLKYRALKMVLPSGDPNVRYIESHNMTWQETCLIWFHIWILLFHSVSYILFLILRPYYSYHM